VVPLFPSALDRCVEREDFLRLELSVALEVGCRLVFLIFETETFSDLFRSVRRRRDSFLEALKTKMSSVLVIFVNMQNFDSSVDKVVAAVA